MPKAAARLRLARVSCHIRPRTAALGEARTPQSARPKRTDRNRPLAHR